MSYDYYEETRVLLQFLKDEGLEKWADMLSADLARGCTSSEILADIRWTLSQLLNEEKTLADAVKTRSRDLIARLTVAIGDEGIPPRSVPEK